MRPVSHVVDSQEAPRDIESPRLHKHFVRDHRRFPARPEAAFVVSGGARDLRRCRIDALDLFFTHARDQAGEKLQREAMRRASRKRRRPGTAEHPPRRGAAR